MKHTLIVVILFASSIAATAHAAETPEEAAARIAKMEKVAEHALVPPVVNTSPLPKYDYDKLDYGMTIGIERTPGGRLWACWVAGGDSPDAFFVLASSDNDGKTWSSPRVVLDSHEDGLGAKRSILVGNLWTDPKGRLWLIFDQSMDMFDGRAGVWATVCENPDSDAPVWSNPRRIWHGVTLNKPTVLSTGEWMLPISLDQRPGFREFRGCFPELDPLRGANVFVSTDEGATWERRGVRTFPNPDWHEHMIVEKKDGSLWMLARTRNGIMESESTDGGRTWSEPVLSSIKHPVARFHIRRLASKRLLLVKHGATIDTHHGRRQDPSYAPARKQPQAPVAVFRQPRRREDLDGAAGTPCDAHRRSPRRQIRSGWTPCRRLPRCSKEQLDLRPLCRLGGAVRGHPPRETGGLPREALS